MKLIWLFQCADDVMKNKTAFVTSNQTYTYADICQAVARTIRTLTVLGVQRGQQVVLIPEHDENAVIFIAAASAIGLQIVMPYNLQHAAAAEWVYIIKTVSPDHVIYLRRDNGASILSEAINRPVNIIELNTLTEPYPDSVDSSDIVVYHPSPVNNFLVLFTSGTTGKPKAISISETLVCKRIALVSRQLKFTANARIFMSGLVNNTTGIIFSFGSLLHDATLIFPKDRAIEAWASQVNHHKITHMMLRPIALRRFVEGAKKSRADLSSLSMLAYGAAALPKKLLEEARQLIPCEWVQGYGLSETFGPFCWLTEDDHNNKLYEKYIYCVGKPDDSLDVSLYFADPAHDAANTTNKVGEIVLRGAGLMEGYLDIDSGQIHPTDEFFHTGDYGHFSDNGELILKGRVTNTIMSENGHRIYPEEVENVLAGVSGIEEVVLLSLPTIANLGNSPVACIHGSLTSLSQNEIHNAVFNQLQAQLSHEKWPDYIYVSRLPFPKSSNDKIIKTDALKLIDPENLIKISITEHML